MVYINDSGQTDANALHCMYFSLSSFCSCKCNLDLLSAAPGCLFEEKAVRKVSVVNLITQKRFTRKKKKQYEKFQTWSWSQWSHKSVLHARRKSSTKSFSRDLDHTKAFYTQEEKVVRKVPVVNLITQKRFTRKKKKQYEKFQSWT